MNEISGEKPKITDMHTATQEAIAGKPESELSQKEKDAIDDMIAEDIEANRQVFEASGMDPNRALSQAIEDVNKKNEAIIVAYGAGPDAVIQYREHMRQQREKLEKRIVNNQETVNPEEA